MDKFRATMANLSMVRASFPNWLLNQVCAFHPLLLFLCVLLIIRFLILCTLNEHFLDEGYVKELSTCFLILSTSFSLVPPGERMDGVVEK